MRNLFLTAISLLLFNSAYADNTQEVGLKCISENTEFWYDGNPLPSNIICRYYPGPQGPYVPYLLPSRHYGPDPYVFNRYMLLPDGRWQQVYENTPMEPNIFLKPGSLENFSKLAEAGKNTKVFIQSPVLEGLVREGRVEWSPVKGVTLEGKRVAVLLSSKSIEELERLKKERQALIDATHKYQDESMRKARNAFISASNPDQLLYMLAKVVRKHAKSIEPIDDLTAIKKGGFDYVFVVDWKYFIRLDLINNYASFPSGFYKDFQEGKIPAITGTALSAVLIDPELKAVQIFSATPLPDLYPLFRPYQTLSEYVLDLSKAFESIWGSKTNDLGNYGAYLDARIMNAQHALGN